MGRFLISEKPEQAQFKGSSPYFSKEARGEGWYKNHPYPFCLPREYAQENLFPEIRPSIQAYFARNAIKGTMATAEIRAIICATPSYAVPTSCSPSLISRRHWRNCYLLFFQIFTK